MELQVDDIVGGTVNCLRLTGRLDAPGADQIGLRFTAAATAPGRHAVVDLSGVSFVASMGIRLLIATARAARTRGSMFLMFGAPELVQAVLTDAAIDQIIPLFPTEAEALKSLPGQ
jgi:anti-sigma B factor antagonist